MTLQTIISKLAEKYGYGTVIASVATVIDAEVPGSHAKARAEKRAAVALLNATATAVDKILGG